MKSKLKVCLVIITLMIILILLTPIKSFCIEAIITGMQDASTIDGSSSNNITISINKIFSLIRYVGSGISIIVVLMLGIKYMISSVEDKADIKKKAIPIVVGCFIIFATTNIIVIISDIVGSL